MKLLELLRAEVRGWEEQLDPGEQPNVGDLSRRAKTGRTSRRVSETDGLLVPRWRRLLHEPK